MPIPKPEQTDTSDPKILRLISLLSCLSKTFEKILASRLGLAGKLTCGISKDLMGCLPNCSAIDTLMVDLIEPHEMLRTVKAYKRPEMKPTIVAKDIDGAFNCVIHERLINILEHYRSPRNLVQCIVAFNTERQIHMAFDRESEQSVPFCAG